MRSFVDLVVVRAGRRSPARSRSTRPIRIDAVVALDDRGRRDAAAAANAASMKPSSDWLSSLRSQPRSPACGAVEASVETVFATSSQALPPCRSRSAWSAFAFAAAFWAAVGSRAPSSTSGSTSMIQAWRCSGIVASVTRRASMSALA